MPQKFVNLENLTSFWGNAKEYIGNERKEIEDQLYNWQKTEKAPVIQCEPVPNSELHPVVDFMFKETLPEGEKGPENSSTITGISEVKITRVGKNIISYPYLDTTVTRNGITYTVNSDGSVTVNGTATNTANFYITTGAKKLKLYKGKTYFLSGVPSGYGEDIYILYEQYNLDNSYGRNYWCLSDGLSITPTSDCLGFFQIIVRSGKTVNNAVFHPQLEISDSATEYEKPTPDICTISLGNTYYGGSVDLSTGLMTVTWISKEINEAPYNVIQYNGYTAFEYRCTNQIQDIPEANKNFVCSHFKTNTTEINIDNARFSLIRLYFSSTSIFTSEDFTAWLIEQKNAGSPVVIAYKLNTPFIINLTPQQIRSLPSLEGTAKRSNILYTNADSIQVEYQKYVGIDSTLDSNSVNAIQNKTVNSALNTKVSLSGDETISGTKTFSNTINGNITGDAGTVAGHIISKDVPVNAAFTDTTYDPATQSTAGLMSASDKVKLDAVGSVFSFKGSVISSSSLPASDNVNGDAYLAEDTGHVHVYDGTNFVDIGIWTGIPSATDAQIDALFED